MKAKMIILDELQKKNKSNTDLMKALKYLNKLDDNYLKVIAYYKYICYYFTKNYNHAFEYLISFFKNIKYFDDQYCEIFIEKLNIIKLYIEINKLPNKDIFTGLIEKINSNNIIKFIQSKMNKFKNKTNPCVCCKVYTECIDYYNCIHLYCLDCINEKKCVYCKTKYVY